MKTCERFHDYEYQEPCDAPACFTTCDPMNGVSCYKHKCRCARALEDLGACPGCTGQQDFDVYSQEDEAVVLRACCDGHRVQFQTMLLDRAWARAASLVGGS